MGTLIQMCMDRWFCLARSGCKSGLLPLVEARRTPQSSPSIFTFNRVQNGTHVWERVAFRWILVVSARDEQAAGSGPAVIGFSPEMQVDGTESIPRCSSRAPRKLSSPRAWNLFTCTNTIYLLMVGMRHEGTKQGGWERAGCGWVKRPCPNTATPRVPLPGDSLVLTSLVCLTSLAGEWASLRRLPCSPFCPCPPCLV